MRTIRLFAVLLPLSLFLLAEVPAPSQAKWLWYPEKFEDSRHQERYFRTEFDVDGQVASAVLTRIIDDEGKETFNGEDIDQKKRLPGGNPVRFDVTGMLRQGRNAFACNVTNEIGRGGYIAHL